MMKVDGVGLGFRREIAEEILALEQGEIAFVEFAPENWIGLGGKYRRLLHRIAEKHPIICHGLSLSLGSPEPLDWNFLKELKVFFSEIPIQLYSEHLSYCKCGNAHLYDLLPIPFTEEAISHVTSRIKLVQDFLERPIAIENVSYYCPVKPEIDEAYFIHRIVEESGCLLLLDVNNVYVNAFNHTYDAHQFLQKMPLDEVAYIHMAGHRQVSDKLIIDTHGNPIIDPVYQLFEWTISRIKPVPILLERDFNFTNFEEIIQEVKMLKNIVDQTWCLSQK